MNEPTRAKRTTGNFYSQGIVVAIALAVLTAVEYYVALTIDWTSILMLLALIKAVLVVNYFMHIKSVWTEEESH